MLLFSFHPAGNGRPKPQITERPRKASSRRPAPAPTKPGLLSGLAYSGVHNLDGFRLRGSIEIECQIVCLDVPVSFWIETLL